MRLWASYKKKKRKIYFLKISLKSMKNGVGSIVGSGSGSVRGTDPGIRIRIRTRGHRSPTLPLRKDDIKQTCT
jgi:hypothetical protein